MSKIVKAHAPCTDCGSSDALTIYEDGSFCFSCNKVRKDGEVMELEEAIKVTTKNSTLTVGQTQELKRRQSVL